MSLKALLQSNRDKLIIAYKILHDILLVGLVFFLFSMIAEGLLPGIITTHVGFSSIIAFIFIDIAIIYILGSYLKINLKDDKYSKKTAWALFIVLTLLLINSLLKTNIFLNLSITIIIITCGYFAYKAILEE